MNTAQYSFGVEGNAYFIRAAAEALEEVMEPFFEGPGWECAPQFFGTLPALKQHHRLMELGGLEIFGTFVVFIGSCFAKKIFDEIYDRTLKRPIAAQLDKFFAKANVPEGKLLEYRDVVYFQDIQLVVVIRTLIDKNDTKAVERDLIEGHHTAHAYIEKNGKKAAIHCHTVLNGKVSPEPFLFDSVAQIKEHDKANVCRIRRTEI
ncbi:MAG: hypothetical protein WC091_05690 [Sulfuricellaceae bacterium]